ncbi:MAG: GNAT family N-acetyltransferase [Oscillospiraceae bacterium]|nr:GNAT family N-acetyltransferase [Oscillospiraceae bacterium]
MKHNYSYQGERILLRPLAEEDIEPFRLLRNRPENRRWFFFADEITEERQSAWYQQYAAKGNDYMFAAALPAEPTCFVGAIAVYNFRQEDNSFEVGRLLLDSGNPACRGLGKELVRGIRWIVENYFPKSVCTSLRAEIYDNNERSIRCFQSNGFQVYGERIEKDRRIVLMRCAVKNNETE